MSCNKCKIRIRKKVDSDTLGGIAMLIGSAFYLLNCFEAIKAGDIVGVSAWWATFFVLLNVLYCYVFAKHRLVWSFLGSSVLAIAESIYLALIIYYS